MTNSRTASFSRFATSSDKLKAVPKYSCTYLVEILRRIVSIKCSEVLQCSDGLSNKASNIIRKHIDNMKLLLIYSFASIFYRHICGCIPVSYCNLCILIVMSVHSYCMFMYLHRAS